MLYVWACTKCNKEVEISRKVADREVPPDEKCCGEYKRIEIPKLVTPGIKGFRLVGEGWGHDGYISRPKPKEES